jgi:type II secretory pathway component PulF
MGSDKIENDGEGSCMSEPTFHEASQNLTRATRNLLWAYSPEMLVILGFLAGMIVMGLLLMVMMR